MNLGLRELAVFLGQHKNDRALVLATVIATEGSSYRKPGAMMLIRENAQFAGLISGGCLEGDLVAHASTVFEGGQPRQVSYDLSDDEYAIWGLGLGCGGTVHILLQRLDRDQGFGFLPNLFNALDRRSTCVLALVHQPCEALPAGTYALINDSNKVFGDQRLHSSLKGRLDNWGNPYRYQYAGSPCANAPGSILLLRIKPPPRILVCGAGPDAVPLARQVDALGWECIVVDHRGAYARPERFPASTKVIQLQPKQLQDEVTLDEVDAAVIMSHNLEHDAVYLQQLVVKNLPYLGVLGPKARREFLQAQLGAGEHSIHGPAGMDIGAELPESIALSMMAEIHAVLNTAGG